MKLAIVTVLMAACAVAAGAQTPSKAASKVVPKAAVKPEGKSTGTVAAKPGGAKKAVASKVAPKPAVVEPKVLFALKYIDLEIGSGPEAEPNKIYKVHYTGWLASDGSKFDSSYDHRDPELDKDGKPVLDEHGQPKLAEVRPFRFAQGFGRVIPGWDLGFTGMRIGGKRKLFIPWQLAYGATGRPPVIPAKADLIFEIELFGTEDLPQPPTR